MTSSARTKDRKKWLAGLRDEPRVVVLFESPHRIAATLSDIAEILGDRPISLSRELTKLHEQTLRSMANSLNIAGIPARGEFTVVLGSVTGRSTGLETHTDDEIAALFGQITDKLRHSKRRALAETGRKFGLSTNEVYAILERRKASSAS